MHLVAFLSQRGVRLQGYGAFANNRYDGKKSYPQGR